MALYGWTAPYTAPQSFTIRLPSVLPQFFTIRLPMAPLGPLYRHSHSHSHSHSQSHRKQGAVWPQGSHREPYGPKGAIGSRMVKHQGKTLGSRMVKLQGAVQGAIQPLGSRTEPYGSIRLYGLGYIAEIPGPYQTSFNRLLFMTSQLFFTQAKIFLRK